MREVRWAHDTIKVRGGSGPAATTFPPTIRTNFTSRSADSPRSPRSAPRWPDPVRHCKGASEANLLVARVTEPRPASRDARTLTLSAAIEIESMFSSTSYSLVKISLLHVLLVYVFLLFYANVQIGALEFVVAFQEMSRGCIQSPTFTRQQAKKEITPPVEHVSWSVNVVGDQQLSCSCTTRIALPRISPLSGLLWNLHAQQCRIREDST